MLQYQVKLAEDLGVHQTVEYEEANRKLMEIGIIEEKMEEARVRIRRDTKRLNICICLTFLLLLLLFILALQFGTSEPDMTLANEQKQAEKEMLEYNSGYITQLKSDAQAHKKVIQKYQASQQKNLKNVKSIINAPISQI